MSNIQAKQAEFMVMAQQRVAKLRDVVSAKGPMKDSELYMNLCEEDFD